MGNILITTNFLSDGFKYETYTWEGDDFCLINKEVLKDCEIEDGVIKVGPYRLLIIEKRVLQNQYYCHKQNLKGFFWQYWFAIKNKFQWVKVRIIRTFFIWNIGSWHDRVMPSWKWIFRR